ncbi:MAG: aspartate 1-decarboxylase [Candidatus Omnitrophota bacterium]
MLISICKSKIAHAYVTEAELYYEGSITIDEVLLKAVNIIPGEKVEVLNLNNGSRIETYAIAGKKGSGQICLNGPAARSGVVGDKLIILSYGLVATQEAKRYKTKVVYLDDNNKIKNQGNR